MDSRETMTKRRTYWHLEELRCRPDDYDIATSRLLYYPGRGFEVTTPIADWYQRYQVASDLQCPDWERFRDPRETTYARYTEIQRTKEVFVDGLLRSIEEKKHDERMDPGWKDRLEAFLPVLRFPFHGLQMVAAYVGSMAPSGRIVVAAAFQAADEVRRIQRIAYRMGQIRQVHPRFGEESRSQWQENPQWQPLRKAIERLLVTYDWGEAFVALNLVMKPIVDELVMVRMAHVADDAGDEVLGKMFFSLAEDCVWHRDWTGALVRMLAEQPAVAAVMKGWIEHWYPLVRDAATVLENEWVPHDLAERRDWKGVAQACRKTWSACGIEGVRVP